MDFGLDFDWAIQIHTDLNQSSTALSGRQNTAKTFVTSTSSRIIVCFTTIFPSCLTDVIGEGNTSTVL